MRRLGYAHVIASSGAVRAERIPAANSPASTYICPVAGTDAVSENNCEFGNFENMVPFWNLGLDVSL